MHKKRYNEQEKEVAMRKWKQDEAVLQSVVCNRCGKQLKVENGVLKEGCRYVRRLAILAQWMEQKSDLTCVRHAIWS